jgi:hypothetical protein
MEIDWNKLTSETNNYPLPITGGNITSEEEDQPVYVPVELDETAYEDLDKIFATDYDNKRLTKEQILNDRRFVNVIRNNLTARYTPGDALTRAKRVGVGLAGGDFGGIYGRDYMNMDAERLFEIWQNYQRSFSAGQTVTVGNEIAYSMNASDDTKVKLGAGYKLFDQMTNAFTGDGSWAEMADATWDYAKAGVYDPATLLGFGLGKLMGFGATRTSAQAAKSLMKSAYTEAIKKGATTSSAKAMIGNAMKNSLPFAFIDATIGGSIDALSQMQLIDVGVQEEYSYAQTAINAGAQMLSIPILTGMGATVKELRSSVFKDTFLGYQKFDTDLLNLGFDEAKKRMKQRMNTNVIVDALDDTFGLIKGDSKDFLVWDKIKERSKKRIKGQTITPQEKINAFYRYLFLGNPGDKNGKGRTKGLFEALNDAGFVPHPAMIEQYGNITGVYANAMKEFLSPAQVKKIVAKWEAETKHKLDFSQISYKNNDPSQPKIEIVPSSKVTPLSLSSRWVLSIGDAAESLWLPSELSRLQKAGVDVRDAIDIAAGNAGKEDSPKRFQFGLSVYKRLLTSHLSTTGANLKGFKGLVSLNTYADFFTGAINLSQSKFYKYGLNDPKKAEEFYNKYYGSVYGALRRGVDVISPDIPIEYADLILDMNPKLEAKLFRDIAGDGGVRESFEHFNLDKADMITFGIGKVMDAATKGAQTLTFVRLQDDLTKRWSFGSNMNQYIMRDYGMTPEQFFSQVDVSIEMASKKFQNLLDKAAYRTMRETASVNWSTLPAKNGMRAAARVFEKFTNTTPAGFIVPFGSFLNTTLATMGDMTGINAFRASYRSLTGKKADFADPEVSEAFGKFAASMSLVSLGVFAARDRIDQGLSYSQERNNEVLKIGPYSIGGGQDMGDIEDKTYDWPVSTIRLLSQITAHAIGETNNFNDFQFRRIPKDLLAELAIQTGGQAFRDLDMAGSVLKNVANKLLEGDAGPLVDFLQDSRSRIIQGATRPFDTPNQIIGMFTDANMNPNLKEGIFLQGEAMRYINNLPALFGMQPLSEGLTEKATPFRGTNKSLNVSKNALGVRVIEEPNTIERMANVAGMKWYDIYRVDAPNSIRNQMNQIAYPFFELRADEALRKNPDYFDLVPNTQKEILVDIAKKVKEDVLKQMEASVPESINIMRVLSNKNEKKVKAIIKILRLEEDNLEDIIKRPDALKVLKTIQHLLDNYGDYDGVEKFFD